MKYVILLGLLALLIFILFACQHGLIYYPRQYYQNILPSNTAVELVFQTSQGKQFSYLYPAKENPAQVPQRVWLLFGGNAALALDWHDFVSRHPDRQAAFLLIEYPGYGKCDGKANAKVILETTKKAVETLAQYFEVDNKTIEQRISVFGHSLGAAAALQYGASIPVEEVVLVSPFTSLRDMAVLVVGKPLHLLLLDHYDNRARLKELVEKASPPRVYIFHGRRDEVVPIRMGRELAGLFPDLVIYRESSTASHNDILTIEERQLYESMQSYASQNYGH